MPDFDRIKSEFVWTYKLFGLPTAIAEHRKKLESLNPSQRALLAASIGRQCKSGHIAYQKEDAIKEGCEAFTSPTLCEAFNLNRWQVSAARTLLKEATPKELKLLQSGQGTVGTAVKLLRKRLSTEERIKWISNRGLAEKGQNIDRLHLQKVEAQVWQQLKTGLVNITTLPHPKDMVALIRKMDKTHITDKKLAAAIAYLKELSHARDSHSDEKAA